MFNPNRADIGRKVTWRGREKDGVITQIDQRYGFVRFDGDENSTVMTRDELEWRDAGAHQ